jgi:hypothetical protein
LILPNALSSAERAAACSVASFFAAVAALENSNLSGHRDAPKRSVATSPGDSPTRKSSILLSFIFLPQSQKRRGPQ